MSTIALRYRGYFYDTETGFYYLQSRYYDPAVGRFVNGDSYASTGTGFLGHNMYTYCLNNPIMVLDTTGKLPDWMCGPLPYAYKQGRKIGKAIGETIGKEYEQAEFKYLENCKKYGILVWSTIEQRAN